VNLIKTVKCKLKVPEKVKLILHDTLLELQSLLVNKLLVFTYSQGTLVIEGKKEEVTLTAQIPSRQVSVTLRDWQVVDILGFMKLSFLGLLSRNHTISGEGGYVVVTQNDKKGELQTSIRVGREEEEEGERIVFLSLVENHRIQWLLRMCID
jgi:hypothetical protein